MVEWHTIHIVPRVLYVNSRFWAMFKLSKIYDDYFGFKVHGFEGSKVLSVII